MRKPKSQKKRSNFENKKKRNEVRRVLVRQYFVTSFKLPRSTSISQTGNWPRLLGCRVYCLVRIWRQKNSFWIWSSRGKECLTLLVWLRRKCSLIVGQLQFVYVIPIDFILLRGDRATSNQATWIHFKGHTFQLENISYTSDTSWPDNPKVSPCSDPSLINPPIQCLIYKNYQIQILFHPTIQLLRPRILSIIQLSVHLFTYSEPSR